MNFLKTAHAHVEHFLVIAASMKLTTDFKKSRIHCITLFPCSLISGSHGKDCLNGLMIFYHYWSILLTAMLYVFLVFLFIYFSLSQSVCTVIVTTCVSTWGKTKCMVLIFVLHRLSPSFKDQQCMITHCLICVTLPVLFLKFEKFSKDIVGKKDPDYVSLIICRMAYLSRIIWLHVCMSIPEGSCVLSIIFFVMHSYPPWWK